MMNPTQKIVGENIRRLRRQRKLTQEHIANYLGIDQTLVSKIESGQRSIGVSALESLCDLFFCTLDELVEVSSPSISSPKTVAFRADGLSTDDLQALAAIGRIARNLEEMAQLEKAMQHDA